MMMKKPQLPDGYISDHDVLERKIVVALGTVESEGLGCVA